MQNNEEWKTTFSSGWALAVRGGDTARTRFLETFVHEHPERELRVKVFFELEHRLAGEGSGESLRDFSHHLLDLAQAQDASGIASPEERTEWVRCLLRLGMDLSHLDAGGPRYGLPVPPVQARQAVCAFQLAEPYLGDADGPSLAQFELFLAKALHDAGEIGASIHRATSAVGRLDTVLTQPDARLGKNERLRLQAMRTEADVLANHR